MNADEVRIIDLLNESPNEFVSVTDVSRKLGKGRRYKEDRTWAAPIMRRMEMDGLLEVNDAGDFRVRKADRQIDFKQALKTPGVSLGDTTIIKLSDVQEQGTASRKQAVR
jgi:hypothetical protein